MDTAVDGGCIQSICCQLLNEYRCDISAFISIKCNMVEEVEEQDNRGSLTRVIRAGFNDTGEESAIKV